MITPTVNNGSQMLMASAGSPSYSLSSAPPSTPYEIHQRLFGYNKRKSKTKSNLAHSASKKSKKDVAWTHTFVCLPDNDIEHVPGDYSVMTANGLGKAKLRLSEGSTAMDIHDTILAQFPKLKVCGGYELLRTSEGSKRLSVLTPPPEGYTGQFLKKVLGHANCYIRPLQHSIDMVECPAATGVEVSV